MSGWWLALVAVVVLAAIFLLGDWQFRRSWRRAVTHYIETPLTPSRVLSEADIQHLPGRVQQYLRMTGCMDHPIVSSFRVEFSGQLRQTSESEWMSFRSTQYNFVQSASRLFFLDATMKHLPVSGFHRYENGKAPWTFGSYP